MILEPGTLLNNRYRIVEVLGQGGMGSVYRATDEHLDIDVAVKDNNFTTDEYARQFRREATILATLRHPRLPRVTDHFTVEGQGQYLVMDYIEGEDLRQRMERVGTLPDEEVIVIGAAICDALMYLCSRSPQVIHRDIKPGNVKITPEGQIFLVDFGLAKTVQGTQATTTGARAMTPGFSPPEQYGTARTDMRTDVFSLGATLYAALTGVTPEDSLARAMNQADLTPIREHNPRVSKKLAAAVERALEVQPEDRYQTAQEFKEALLESGAVSPWREGDYYIAPPPEDQFSHAAEAAGSVKKMEKVPSKPKIFPNAQEVLESVASKSKPRRTNNRPKQPPRRTGCLLAVGVIGLFLGLGIFYYLQNPASATRSIAQALPGIAAYLPGQNLLPADISAASPTSTVSQPPPATAPVEVVLTEPAALPDTPTRPPNTPRPTQTLAPFRPTQTPTSLPTPVGGGAGMLAYTSYVSGVPQIFLIQSDGSRRQQITDLDEGACQPDFSPDGDRIVFTSPCANSTDYYPGSSLYIINLDGSGLLPLPTMVGGDYDPAWSPDGKKIAFTSLRNNSRTQIYVLNLEDNSVQALSEKFNVDRQPAWSPDGKRLLFVQERNGRRDIWVMNADGSDQRQFTRTPTFLDSLPSWSPDGKNVLVTQYVAENGVPRVVIAPFDLEDYVEYQIGKEKRPMRDAVFSPDGYWIAYEGWEIGGKHNIYLITATGISVHQVTDESALTFDPVWRPVTSP